MFIDEEIAQALNELDAIGKAKVLGYMLGMLAMSAVTKD